MYKVTSRLLKIMYVPTWVVENLQLGGVLNNLYLATKSNIGIYIFLIFRQPLVFFLNDFLVNSDAINLQL